jgi:putative thiamine transport system permease protein
MIGRWISLFLALPVLAGLAGTLAPALGQGGFAALFAWPGLPRAMALSLGAGLASTALALGAALAILAYLRSSAVFRLLRGALAPFLALPHAAAALGLAFLIAPSGWIARLISPWATGWQVPPDLLILNDPLGLALILGLVVKELPFLLLVMLAAHDPARSAQAEAQARLMGHGDAAAFLAVEAPGLLRAVRLPVLAVLTYGMTSVDMGLVLGPDLPPPLAVQITLWMGQPGGVPTAAAGALVQLALVGLGLGLWRLVEVAAGRAAQAVWARGWRLRGLDRLRCAMGGLALIWAALLAAAVAALALWSVAGLWPFPDDWPQTLTTKGWTETAPGLLRLSAMTLALAMGAGLLALCLSLAVLETEARGGRRLPESLIYLPLILPQVAVLPGLQVALLTAGAGGGPLVVGAAHLLFVFPYVHLALAGPWRAWDARFAVVGATLGAGPWRIFWRLRLPMLTPTLAGALAIGVAVSVGQYLPTLMLGGGRVETLTTEALALASGGNRRLTAVHALTQVFWPMLAFALALMLPPLIARLRMGRSGV